MHGFTEKSLKQISNMGNIGVIVVYITEYYDKGKILKEQLINNGIEELKQKDLVHWSTGINYKKSYATKHRWAKHLNGNNIYI